MAARSDPSPRPVPHQAYASLRFPEFRAYLALTGAVSVATQVQSADPHRART